MAASDRATLNATYNQSVSGAFPDNTSRLIAPSNLRNGMSDIFQSFRNIVEDSYIQYTATASGTNTYTASLSPAITAYASNHVYWILFTNANTGAATLNLNGKGAKTIVKNGSTALASGDISAGQIYALAYDGTNMQIISGKATSPGGSNTQIQYNNSGAFGGVSGLTYNGSSLKGAFNADSGTPGLNIGSYAGDPSSKSDGQIWLNTSTNSFKGHVGGSPGSDVVFNIMKVFNAIGPVTLPAASANSQSTLNLSVTGAAFGQFVFWAPQSASVGSVPPGIIYGYVSASNQVTLVYVNNTTSTQTPSSMNIYIMLVGAF